MTFFSSMFSHQNRFLSFWGQVYTCLLFFLILNLANAEPVFQLHSLDKAQGMVSSIVYHIAQDSDGFMWFATQDGLQKYNGVKFVNYRHSRLNENSLSSNIVRNILVDKGGQIWLGTESGVNLYQKKFDNFKRVGLGVATYKIRSLYQSSNGTIWIGSTNGLAQLDVATFKVKHYQQGRVRTIFEDDHKQIWIGTLNKGLFLFDQISERFIPVNTSISSTKTSNERIDLSDVSIIDIFQDSYNRILVATWSKRVHLLNRDTRSLSPYELELPSKKVRTIHEDEEGEVWAEKKGADPFLQKLTVDSILDDKGYIILL